MENSMFTEILEVVGLRGGEGSVLIEKANETMVNCKMYARITILPNSSIGMHEHIEDEEMVYVISGEGIAYINGEYQEIKTGEYHYAKRGNKHSIINNSQGNLVILAIINE